MPQGEDPVGGHGHCHAAGGGAGGGEEGEGPAAGGAAQRELDHAQREDDRRGEEGVDDECGPAAVGSEGHGRAEQGLHPQGQGEDQEEDVGRVAQVVSRLLPVSKKKRSINCCKEYSDSENNPLPPPHSGQGKRRRGRLVKGPRRAESGVSQIQRVQKEGSWRPAGVGIGGGRGRGRLQSLAGKQLVGS